MSDWNPDDPTLAAKALAHEATGVMRMHRSGVGSKAIMGMLKLRGTQLIAQLSEAREIEIAAGNIGMEIHDAFINEES